ncbi:hypothetical protein [Cupriavidus laharis]|nr:hypothetical protein [Cupriavidus laharis]
MSSSLRTCLYLMLLAAIEPSWAQDLVECRRIDQEQLAAASTETLLFLRCRARRISYEAPRIKGVSQRVKDDLMFACLDQVDAVEHQLRVRHGYTRESLSRERCE